jgi:oxepin-CoA hydrolase/3-oxo-5,6-dehydrosuberyl-CoA semialdehyde dehydrogenase
MSERIDFDVNDENLRRQFLREVLPRAIASLESHTPPRWGGMSAQQMIEHLTWAFDLSIGTRQVECPFTEDQCARRKPFLYDNRPSPHDFMNPALVAGLPPLQHPTLPEARAALLSSVRRFLDLPDEGTGERHIHPIFGPLDRDEWSRTHFKHGFHHLSQFGLVARRNEDRAP